MGLPSKRHVTNETVVQAAVLRPFAQLLLLRPADLVQGKALTFLPEIRGRNVRRLDGRIGILRMFGCWIWMMFDLRFDIRFLGSCFCWSTALVVLPISRGRNQAEFREPKTSSAKIRNTFVGKLQFGKHEKLENQITSTIYRCFLFNMMHVTDYTKWFWIVGTSGSTVILTDLKSPKIPLWFTK